MGGIGLLRRGPSRADAQEALASARGIVEILKITVDLSTAELLLQEAEAAIERGDSAAAVRLAGKAERVGSALETDYRAVSEVAATLRAHTERMRDLGMNADAEEGILSALEAGSSATREIEGIVVPHYAANLEAAREAVAGAEARLALSEGATNAIFAAELALDGAVDISGGASEPLQEAAELLEKARAEVADGRFELAATDASVAEKIALGTLEQRRRAQETLASVERLLAGLRGAGVPITSVSKMLDLGRTLLTKGKLVAAIDVFNEAAQEAVVLGTRYRETLDALSGVGAAMDALRAEGLKSPEAESALTRAKSAVKQGNLALALGCAEDVHLAVRRARETRDGLRTWLDETKAQVATLRDLGLAFVNDVEEMVGKAEVAFENGDLAATGEDLRIASLLLSPSMNGKKEKTELRPEGS